MESCFTVLFCQALAYYNRNSEITEMLNNMDIYILTVMNPDGYKYTWTTVIC